MKNKTNIHDKSGEDLPPSLAESSIHLLAFDFCDVEAVKHQDQPLA